MAGAPGAAAQSPGAGAGLEAAMSTAAPAAGAPAAAAAQSPSAGAGLEAAMAEITQESTKLRVRRGA